MRVKPGVSLSSRQLVDSSAGDRKAFRKERLLWQAWMHKKHKDMKNVHDESHNDAAPCVTKPWNHLKPMLLIFFRMVHPTLHWRHSSGPSDAFSVQTNGFVFDLAGRHHEALANVLQMAKWHQIQWQSAKKTVQSKPTYNKITRIVLKNLADMHALQS